MNPQPIPRSESAPQVDLHYCDLSRDEKSCIVYLETCVVDAGGLVEGLRMNAADHEVVARFRSLGLLEFYRVPASLLSEGMRLGQGSNHIVRFSEGAWLLAHEGRRARSERLGPFALKVFVELADMGKIATATTTPEAS